MKSLDGSDYKRRSITQSDLGFLEQLQHELNTQPTLATADPRFWVIRDYEYVQATENDAIHAVELFEDGEGEVMSLAEAATRAYQSVAGNMTEDEAKAWLDGYALTIAGDGKTVKAKASSIAIPSMQQVIDDYAEISGFDCVYLTKRWRTVSDTLFLTLREAEDHLETNYYHYTSEACTYCMHAWRSPDFEQLINLLHEVDFNELSQLVEEKGGERQ